MLGEHYAAVRTALAGGALLGRQAVAGSPQEILFGTFNIMYFPEGSQNVRQTSKVSVASLSPKGESDVRQPSEMSTGNCVRTLPAAHGEDSCSMARVMRKAKYLDGLSSPGANIYIYIYIYILHASLMSK